MVENISPIGPQENQKISKIPSQSKPEKSFKEIFDETLKKVNDLHQEADINLQKLYTGEATIDEVVVSFRKAEIATQTLVQIRNKLFDAYEELMRMRV